jgi:hypothetical protein
MDYKRQTTVLSVVFVLVGMMFLVPAITEKALAAIDAFVVVDKILLCPHLVCFTNIKGHMFEGRFVKAPTGRTGINWITAGRGLFGGTERGYVTADTAGQRGPVTLHFFNPAKGTNTCSVEPSDRGKCTIGQGAIVEARYVVFL